MAETTKETKIVVDEGGIHRQTVTTETAKKIDWQIEFPEGVSQYCKERIISDYKNGKIEPGYSRNCDFTTSVFSLNPLGFSNVPVGENWQVVVSDKGVKFNSLPALEIEKDNFFNILGIILLAIAWILLAGINGYIGKERRYLFSLFCLSPGILYLLNIFSINCPGLVTIVMIIIMILGIMAVYSQEFLILSIWSASLTIISAAFSILEILSSGFILSYLSRPYIHSYALFQLVIFAYALAFREVVYAWRKEKLVTPKMVKAKRKFEGHINEDNKSQPCLCGCILFKQSINL